MRKDIARVRLHGDFLQFTELLRHPIQHRLPPRKKLLPAASVTGDPLKNGTAILSLERTGLPMIPSRARLVSALQFGQYRARRT
jgi:hypothetical protein